MKQKKVFLMACLLAGGVCFGTLKAEEIVLQDLYGINPIDNSKDEWDMGKNRPGRIVARFDNNAVKYANTSKTNITKQLRAGESYTRSQNNLYDYLDAAKFKNQDAMRKYESWANGRPDVYVKMCFKNQVGGEKTIYYEDTGWWEGAWKSLNSQIINWNPDVIGVYLTYVWLEDDPESALENLLVTLKGGYNMESGVNFGADVQMNIKIGKKDEHIGTSYVYYYDPVPFTYDPTGTEDFIFTTKLN